MKKILVVVCFMTVITTSAVIYGGMKGAGERCTGDAECAFGSECRDGVCVKKREFDFGGSGKTGKPCEIDADCIGSGKCVEGDFGKKYCSGN